ncbi:MAG: AAA family ATPase, partial [Clostridia bacterium]
MSIKINTLEFENTKRIKAVKMSPSANGLTVIGGRNGQGKTSILDSIAWALGGEKYRPSSAEREGSVTPPMLRITLNNGLIVERKGKNSSLKVIDPNGNKGGQQLLNEFVSELAIDLPKFLNANNKEKAHTLLQIIGVGDELFRLEKTENELYNRRHAFGQIADQKKKFADEQPYFADAPKELISASELIRQQQEILARNGENQRLRQHQEALIKEESEIIAAICETENRLKDLQSKKNELAEKINLSMKTTAELVDESTEELERNIENIELINTRVRANMAKEMAEEEAKKYKADYDEMTEEIESVRREKIDLLNRADLPLPGLSVEAGELLYKGKKWDCMSGSEQLKVATAIV